MTENVAAENLEEAGRGVHKFHGTSKECAIFWKGHAGGVADMRTSIVDVFQSPEVVGREAAAINLLCRPESLSTHSIIQALRTMPRGEISTREQYDAVYPGRLT